jgi:small subunit ribosomal protein S21|tara:strand:+ start:1254 stop:1448 length:195 start_codon:yes stop_codon:yes gene_type:complete
MAVNVKVSLRRNETIEKMIKRFSKKVRNEGIIDEVRERMYYEKPSAKRRRLKAKGKKEQAKLKK